MFATSYRQYQYTSTSSLCNAYIRCVWREMTGASGTKESDHGFCFQPSCWYSYLCYSKRKKIQRLLMKQIIKNYMGRSWCYGIPRHFFARHWRTSSRFWHEKERKTCIYQRPWQGAKEKNNAYDVLAAAQMLTLDFLKCEDAVIFKFLKQNEEIDNYEDHKEAMKNTHAGNIQVLIKMLLRSLFHKICLGYRNSNDERILNTFVQSYSNVLCFVETNWTSFLCSDSPSIPITQKKYMSLQLLALTSRK